MGSGRTRDDASAKVTARLMMPGRTLHRLTARLCSERSLERVVEPAIADLQKEYTAATLGSTLMTSLRLPIALPVGLTLGIALALGGRAVSRHAVRVILLTALAAVAISYATMVWSWPVASYSFRQSLSNTLGARGPVVRAANDISAAAMHQERYFGAGGDRMARTKRLAWTRHLRDAMAFAAPALAVFALALLRRRAPRAVLMAACAGYFLLLLLGERLVYQGMPPLAAAWMANIVFAAAATILLMRRTGAALGRPA